MAQSTGGNPSEAKAATMPETKGGAAGASSSRPISPARNPTKGGDFDVVKVSRIASIAIKTTGTDNGYSYRSSLGGGKKVLHKKKQNSKKAGSKEKQAPAHKQSDNGTASKEKDEEKLVSRTKQKINGASTNERTRSEQTAESQNDKRSNSSSRRDSSKDNKTVRKRAVRELQDEEDESSDEEIVFGTDPMDVITVSPYEGDANAERDVRMFEDLHSVLTEGSIKASKIFGDVNARIMVRAYSKLRLKYEKDDLVSCLGRRTHLFLSTTPTLPSIRPN